MKLKYFLGDPALTTSVGCVVFFSLCSITNAFRFFPAIEQNNNVKQTTQASGEHDIIGICAQRKAGTGPPIQM